MFFFSFISIIFCPTTHLNLLNACLPTSCGHTALNFLLKKPFLLLSRFLLWESKSIFSPSFLLPENLEQLFIFYLFSCLLTTWTLSNGEYRDHSIRSWLRWTFLSSLQEQWIVCFLFFYFVALELFPVLKIKEKRYSVLQLQPTFQQPAGLGSTPCLGTQPTQPFILPSEWSMKRFLGKPRKVKCGNQNATLALRPEVLPHPRPYRPACRRSASPKRAEAADAPNSTFTSTITTPVPSPRPMNHATLAAPP